MQIWACEISNAFIHPTNIDFPSEQYARRITDTYIYIYFYALKLWVDKSMHSTNAENAIIDEAE